MKAQITCQRRDNTNPRVKDPVVSKGIFRQRS